MPRDVTGRSGKPMFPGLTGVDKIVPKSEPGVDLPEVAPESKPDPDNRASRRITFANLVAPFIPVALLVIKDMLIPYETTQTTEVVKNGLSIPLMLLAGNLIGDRKPIKTGAGYATAFLTSAFLVNGGSPDGSVAEALPYVAYLTALFDSLFRPKLKDLLKK